MNKLQQKNELINVRKQKGIKDKSVLKAIDKIPRHLFIPKKYQDSAYEDFPLPIGKEQTISQPYTVAFMLQALELKSKHKALEVGTGSGWNAALIAEMIKPGKIYTTETIPKLAKTAKKNISKTNLKNINIIKTDGSKGHKKQAPYDRIIITAACPSIPQPLINQLKPKGILVAPIGHLYNQTLFKIKKLKNKLKKERLGDFRFVPLTGEYGY